MEIHTNQELAEFVKKAIKASGIKKTELAESIGLSRQGLDNLLKKKSFSLDDANLILKQISLKAIIDVDTTELEIFVSKKIKNLLK